ncbi:zinc finger protein 73-like isoform X2 [Bufo bufo]|uniref:zinc finger protein 73-like isoform X2 n=1 Tax=Bufo bufo TaxID=8384 RepID=UPI001ABDE476|nr:zinc finger protein 73-like isoform X2 [Bufo bufo]
MEKDKSYMTEKILRITLDIIYLLTGEDYTLVKKSSKDVASTSSLHLMGGLRRTLRCTTVLPCHSLTHDNEQKVLELAHKIIHLLTVEEENTGVEEETYVRVELQCKEEDISRDIEEHNQWTLSDRHLESSSDNELDGIDVAQESAEEHPVTEFSPAHANNGDDSIIACRVPHIDSMFQCIPQNTNLMSKQNLHVTEKQFPCYTCGRTFGQKATLIRHERIHRGEAICLLRVRKMFYPEI